MLEPANTTCLSSSSEAIHPLRSWAASGIETVCCVRANNVPMPMSATPRTTVCGWPVTRAKSAPSAMPATVSESRSPMRLRRKRSCAVAVECRVLADADGRETGFGHPDEDEREGRGDAVVPVVRRAQVAGHEQDRRKAQGDRDAIGARAQRDSADGHATCRTGVEDIAGAERVAPGRNAHASSAFEVTARCRLDHPAAPAAVPRADRAGRTGDPRGRASESARTARRWPTSTAVRAETSGSAAPGTRSPNGAGLSTSTSR